MVGMTKTMSRPASEKQVAFITRMIGQKDLTTLDDETLDRVADVEGDVEIEMREASALIDALMAAPWKKRAGDPLVSTYAQRAAEGEYHFERGDHVVNARGRKIPKGAVGQIIKVVDGQWGTRAFLLMADGEKVWTALSNLEHDMVKEGVA